VCISKHDLGVPRTEPSASTTTAWPPSVTLPPPYCTVLYVPPPAPALSVGHAQSGLWLCARSRFDLDRLVCCGAASCQLRSGTCLRAAAIVLRHACRLSRRLCAGQPCSGCFLFPLRVFNHAACWSLWVSYVFRVCPCCCGMCGGGRGRGWVTIRCLQPLTHSDARTLMFSKLLLRIFHAIVSGASC